MHHQPSVATHTVELLQLCEINALLTSTVTGLTAADIGLISDHAIEGTSIVPLPPTAVLEGLGWDGPPAYPYIHAHFVSDGRPRADAGGSAHRRPARAQPFARAASRVGRVSYRPVARVG